MAHLSQMLYAKYNGNVLTTFKVIVKKNIWLTFLWTKQMIGDKSRLAIYD